VDQKAYASARNLPRNIDVTQVDLQAKRTSVDTRTKNHLETITDTRKYLHRDLGLMIQVETQMAKTLIDTTRRGLEAKITKAGALAERGCCQRTGTGADA
jgi:hypothetical protein